MNGRLSLPDVFIFALYIITVAAYGFSIYLRRKETEKSTNDFFLAEGSLTWWAIGASIIASNISAEQFIGMSGSGFAMGLAIASYEWMAALGLIIVALFFLPVYLRNRIATMPEYLVRRYNEKVGTVMAVFWLLVYVLVNLTSILYLGALAISTVTGISFTVCVVGLALFTALITLGGMKVIGYTDVIQVVVLILGGVATSVIVLNLVAQKAGGTGWLLGLSTLLDQLPSHFHMILSKGQMIKPDGGDAYMDLPGLSVLIGGMWIMNLSYWGCNQYITQRALGAKNLTTAQYGLLFAAFLKMLMPFIVILPGIAAFYLYSTGDEGNVFSDVMREGDTVRPDKAYPLVLNLLPSGLKGLAFAALSSAIVASIAGKANSIATIYTLDIHRKYFNTDATDKQLIRHGRKVIIISLLIACFVAPFLSSLDQGFQYIQEYTGFITPGVIVIFAGGLFWKKATATAAWWVALSTIPLSAILKIATPLMPFMDRMSVVFLAETLLLVVLSLFLPEKTAEELVAKPGDFNATIGFWIGAMLLMGLLAALYVVFW